jgi:glycosyltransferase involved in cell wall biosynthesis
MANIISLVSYPFLPARVGGQKGVALFNQYLSRFHHLICVTTRRNDPAAADGYRVLNILSNSPWRYLNPGYFFTIRRLIRQERASHLILEHPYYGWLGCLLKWFCRVRLVVHSHNLEGLRWKSLGKWWWKILWVYERFTHRRADFNFFIHDESREYAIRNFGLDPDKCLTVPFGIDRTEPPPTSDIERAKRALRAKYRWDDAIFILLFNGAFAYPPNRQALDRILGTIDPLLGKLAGFDYRILICGQDLPSESGIVKSDRIILAGFVDDLPLYLMGCDLFINPVTEGGGIKTKLVEALGYNLNAVSTPEGATGVNPDWCGGKLYLSGADDWDSFVALIPGAAAARKTIPPEYFQHFYWGYTVQRAAAFLIGK